MGAQAPANQRNIFDYIDPTAEFHGGNRESVEAHDSIRSAKQRLRKQVLDYIKAHPFGCTSDEVEAALGLSHQTVSARMTELKADGQIVPTGERRKTRSGRNAGVYLVRL